MDKVDKYRQIVTDLLSEYASYKPAYGQIERQLIVDAANDHYLLFNTGWDKSERIHGASIHIDIIGDKVWIQDNRTDSDIAQELLEMGVAREDIVLGFLPPARRQYTEYATG